MKVKDLIAKLSEYEEDAQVRCFDMGGNDIVHDVIDFDEQGNKLHYPTIRFGSV